MGQARLRGTYEERKEKAKAEKLAEANRRIARVRAMPKEQQRRAAHVLGILAYMRAMGEDI